MISVETLYYFKNSLEQVIQQDKFHFKQAQQYFNTGVRINAERNILAGAVSIRKDYILQSDPLSFDTPTMINKVFIMYEIIFYS